MNVYFYDRDGDGEVGQAYDATVLPSVGDTVTISNTRYVVTHRNFGVYQSALTTCSIYLSSHT